MRFLADENFPLAAVRALTQAGHDVVWVRAANAGMPDAQVLDWVRREQRILLTFDKDFGEHARAAELPRECGVILFRTPMPSAGEAGARLASLVTSRSDWARHFSVIEPGRVRMRRLSSFG